MTRSAFSVLHNVIILPLMQFYLCHFYFLCHVLLGKSMHRSHLYKCILQVIWYRGPCTSSSRYTSRTPAMGLQSTRRPPTPQCTGSLRPSTPCVTSCTAHRWNGRTPTLSPPKSPYRRRGESNSNPGNDAAIRLLVFLWTKKPYSDPPKVGLVTVKLWLSSILSVGKE